MNVKKYFADNSNIIDWRSQSSRSADIIPIWKPQPLKHEQWPPDYRGVYAWRIQQLNMLRANPELLVSAKAYYRTRPGEFIMHWMDTYDPRMTVNKWMPFVFFWRQQEFIEFLHECRNDGESGLTEKCRDAGATWLACGYSVWSFLFIDDDAIGWGSRKQELVDRIGDPDSIFEKLRLILRRLPDIWLPEGFDQKKHATFMKLLNPENGATISGESGDNIGRGGRKSLYFKDESAHYERPEKIEAALGDNTNVQIDISSVNGLGNVFHRRREAGVEWFSGVKIESGYTRVFIIDWRHHPAKTQEWYDKRKAKYEREGMLHIFAQEVDRNYAASVQNTIIPHEWIIAAIDAHKKIRWTDNRGVQHMGIPDAYFELAAWIGGLDVADGGIDRNALALRQSIIWRDTEEWGERDPGVSTRRTITRCRPLKGIRVQYDCIGIGSSVKSEYNRLLDDKILTTDDIRLIPWNAGAAVVNPYDHVILDDDDSPLNRDFYGNMKAQAWWSIRARFYKTFKNVTEGVIYPLDELISLDSQMLLLHQVIKELAQPTRGENGLLKTIVNKKPDGTKSPNLADAGIMAFFPVDENSNQTLVGSYGH